MKFAVTQTGNISLVLNLNVLYIIIKLVYVERFN